MTRPGCVRAALDLAHLGLGPGLASDLAEYARGLEVSEGTARERTAAEIATDLDSVGLAAAAAYVRGRYLT